ncbi:molecular chaperone DnaJ [Salmonella enterica]|nr:molecular chaperone DnaJ [Salmonella enterica]EAO0118575.1 molecular chaperone DnaJ [Salmonella enterica]EAO3601678.1 molecular chaperone DnaJ [Salmonella enterica]EAR6391573.1 molecular chaperone DnaJ [Salmonella enterica]EAV1285337.1 molecular chaperone DnaJ [Salmonella enterica]
MANPVKCPRCGGDNGFHTKEIVDYKSIYEWDGTFAEGQHTNHIHGGKRFYCCDCGKDITRHIEHTSKA